MISRNYAELAIKRLIALQHDSHHSIKMAIVSIYLIPEVVA
jgi:hypothetical protein